MRALNLLEFRNVNGSVPILVYGGLRNETGLETNFLVVKPESLMRRQNENQNRFRIWDGPRQIKNELGKINQLNDDLEKQVTFRRILQKLK